MGTRRPRGACPGAAGGRGAQQRGAGPPRGRCPPGARQQLRPQNGSVLGRTAGRLVTEPPMSEVHTGEKASSPKHLPCPGGAHCPAGAHLAAGHTCAWVHTWLPRALHYGSPAGGSGGGQVTRGAGPAGGPVTSGGPGLLQGSARPQGGGGASQQDGEPGGQCFAGRREAPSAAGIGRGPGRAPSGPGRWESGRPGVDSVDGGSRAEASSGGGRAHLGCTSPFLGFCWWEVGPGEFLCFIG